MKLFADSVQMALRRSIPVLLHARFHPADSNGEESLRQAALYARLRWVRFVHHAEVSRRNEPLLSIIINEIAHVEVIQIWDTDPSKIPIQMPLHKPNLGPFALSDLVPSLNSMAFFLRPMIST